MSRRQQVLYLAAAWCLSYPDEELIAKVPLIRAALVEFPGAVQDFDGVLDLLESSAPMEIQAHYVREFDLGRFLRAGQLDPRPVITHRFPLASIAEAIQVIKDGQAGKVILEIGA